MKKIVPTIVVFLTIFPSVFGQKEADKTLSELQNFKIDTFLQHQMTKYNIPAISIAIIDNGVVKLQKTYGSSVVEFNIPNSDSTAFQLASVTKLISASVIMLLVQEGKLNLEEKVMHYLSEVPGTWNNMKVIDLVAHQSGIFDLLSLKHNFTSLKEALDTAYSRPLDFEPGTKTVYAGGDYAVLMKLVETVTGMSFQEFLQKELLDKLGMKHTGYNNMEQDYIYRTYDIMPYAASVYSWNEKTQKQRIFSMMFPKWTYPSGGLFSSIGDLTKWVIALDKNTLHRPEYTELMWTPAKLKDGKLSPFGVGWIVDKHNGKKATGHSGGPALADIVRLPEQKITVIVLTNQLNLRPFLTMKVLDIYTGNNN